MKDCSVVTATYELDEGMKGTIGIIGPKHMEYTRVMSLVNFIGSLLETSMQNWTALSLGDEEDYE